MTLRLVIFAACHTSPVANHNGIFKTRMRITSRFWWPGITKDVMLWTKQCAHCILANNTAHDFSRSLHSYPCKGPFDVLFLDVWSPGDISGTSVDTKVLTVVEGLVSYAITIPLTDETSETVAKMAYQFAFTPFGLPFQIYIDQGSSFKGTLQAACMLLGIAWEAVAPENHMAIRNERYHRYMNKVVKLAVTDVKSIQAWSMAITFSN